MRAARGDQPGEESRQATLGAEHTRRRVALAERDDQVDEGNRIQALLVRAENLATSRPLLREQDELPGALQLLEGSRHDLVPRCLRRAPETDLATNFRRIQRKV